MPSRRKRQSLRFGAGLPTTKWRRSVTHCTGKSGRKTLALAASLALLGTGAGSISAQVKVTLAGDIPATGPGTKYPTLQVCNETNLPQQVEGWKFKTKDYAGY